jgi:hypothetical protein
MKDSPIAARGEKQFDQFIEQGNQTLTGTAGAYLKSTSFFLPSFERAIRA